MIDHEDQNLLQLKCVTQSLSLDISICARLILGLKISPRCKLWRT